MDIKIGELTKVEFTLEEKLALMTACRILTEASDKLCEVDKLEAKDLCIQITKAVLEIGRTVLRTF